MKGCGARSNRSQRSKAPTCYLCPNPATQAGKCEQCRKAVARYTRLTDRQTERAMSRLLVKVCRLQRSRFDTDEAYLEAIKRAD